MAACWSNDPTWWNAKKVNDQHIADKLEAAFVVTDYTPFKKKRRDGLIGCPASLLNRGHE
jgi:hypothetical protein